MAPASRGNARRCRNRGGRPRRAPPWLPLRYPATVSIVALMKQIAAREARNRFGHVLDAAQRAPVRVSRKGRPVGVIMSMQHYERLRGAAWERLTATMDALGGEASANGLTEAGLDALLVDES